MLLLNCMSCGKRYEADKHHLKKCPHCGKPTVIFFKAEKPKDKMGYDEAIKILKKSAGGCFNIGEMNMAADIVKSISFIEQALATLKELAKENKELIDRIMKRNKENEKLQAEVEGLKEKVKKAEHYEDEGQKDFNTYFKNMNAEIDELEKKIKKLNSEIKELKKKPNRTQELIDLQEKAKQYAIDKQKEIKRSKT